MEGVIDRDYSAPVGIALYTHALTFFIVSKNEKIAQLMRKKMQEPMIKELHKLQTTFQGRLGFGSPRERSCVHTIYNKKTLIK